VEKDLFRKRIAVLQANWNYRMRCKGKFFQTTVSLFESEEDSLLKFEIRRAICRRRVLLVLLDEHGPVSHSVLQP